MANERDSFLREIEEEVRRERLTKLWDKYGVALLAGLTAIIVIYGGWKFYERSARTATVNAGAQFAEVTQMLNDGKQDDAILGFKQIVEESPGGYAQLARLRLAAHARKNGETDETLKYYEELASNSSTDALIRDFAKLQIASLKLDNDDWLASKNRLQDLLSEDNPWKYAAREILGLAAYRAGKFKEAQEALTHLIASRETPRSIKQRAELVMALVTRDIAAPRAGTTQTTKGQQKGDSQEAKKTGEAKTK